MPRLQLETASDVLNLDEQFDTGLGYQVHSGVTGFGLPNVATQWIEGAGDGATYRGRRALPRDIDLPLTILAADRDGLQAKVSRLALALAGECTLRLIEDDGTSWYTKAHRVGGGQYVYGLDTTGEREIGLVVTMRAGDPYWTATDPLQTSLQEDVPRALLPKLVHLRVSASQTIGSFVMENLGDAPAHPTWVIYGPGDNFLAVSPSGETLHWAGSLGVGESLTIDTRSGSVIDNTGANRYAELAPAPKMWLVPPGTATVTASLQNTTPDSRVEVTWRPRRWMVV